MLAGRPLPGAAFESQLPLPLQHFRSFPRRGIEPAFTQLRTLRRRQGGVGMEILSHSLLLLRRELLKTLPALPDDGLLSRRQLLPGLEPSARIQTLLWRHRRPALGARGQCLLTVGGQTRPLRLESSERLLLLR